MKRLLLLALLLLASPAFAQVAFDATTQGSSTVNAALTINHTSSGSNRYACYGFHWFGNPTISTVTMGGAGMTAVIAEFGYSGESRVKIALYCSVAPPTSSTAFVVTMTGSVDFIAGGVVSFTGVHQTVPAGTPATGEGTASPSTQSLSINANEMMLDLVGGTFSALVDAGTQDSRVEVENPGGNDSSLGMGTQAGTGSLTSTWTLTIVVGRYVKGAVAVLPAAGASSGLLRRRRN